MAFPAVRTADTKNGVVTSNSNSWTLTYPTNLVSGDLIIALAASDGSQSGGVAWPSGWFANLVATLPVSLVYARKVSDGTETGNFTLTLPASEQGGWRVFRITGWGGDSPGSGAWGNNPPDGGVVQLGAALGADTNPNPPSLDPENWGTEDTLWIAACGVDTSRTISAYPLADLNTADVSGGAGGATLGVCMVNSAVASLDPGTFTISTSDDWVAATYAIRPARVPRYTPYPQLLAH